MAAGAWEEQMMRFIKAICMDDKRGEKYMNKKGVALLLATSMLFTMNSVAFADEAVVADELVTVEAVDAGDEAVDEQLDYDDSSDDSASTAINDSIKAIAAANEKVQSINGTDMIVDVPNTVPYTGKKITATDLGLTITSDSGYTIPVKKIKITDNKKANATGVIKYKPTGIYPWKYITGGADRSEYNLKAVYKEFKTALKTAKNTEFQAYVEPRTIVGSVSSSLIKSLKKNKSLSRNDLWIDIDGDGFEEYIGSSVIITTKNGTVKKVQLVNVTLKYQNTYDQEAGINSFYYKKPKITLKKLNPKTDYTVSGEYITFKGNAKFSSFGSLKSTD